jgi:hypothetical protein
LVSALHVHPTEDASLVGVVLKEDADPKKQKAIPNVKIMGTNGDAKTVSSSDQTGFFHLTLHGRLQPDRPIALSFAHPDYKPLSMAANPGYQLYVARMTPTIVEEPPEPTGPEIVISDVHIRYTVKTLSTANQETVVQTFQAVNSGSVACKGATTCSPDGRWKAAVGSVTLEAPEQGQFKDVRVSCIAGPCPFTKVEADVRSEGDRKLKVSALNWSDTTTFLVEADVVHTYVSDLVRQSFPIIYGRGMSFTLPGTASGPSIEAELNGSDIVFPLGPALILSWANCTLTIDADHSRLYSCELKPGYRFSK